MKTLAWLLLGWMSLVVQTLALPPAVDLSADQTPVKDQASCGNRFIQTTVAAMEAAYKRAGYENVDLSELFPAYMGPMFFLEAVEWTGPNDTPTMRVPMATERETSLLSDQALSVESAEPCMQLAIPEELYMPNRPVPANLGKHPDPNDPFWANQFTVSSFNLDPVNLPPFALSAPRYYQIRSMKWLSKKEAQTPAAIEAVLAKGHEVIWAFRWPNGDGALRYLLLIGYNRTDPKNPYFLVKTGRDEVDVGDSHDGFSRISYDFLHYGEQASTIQKVANPKPWPELKFIGRWHLDAEEIQGVLDLYHLPGMMQKEFDRYGFQDESGQPLRDRRLGTFYTQGDPHAAYRVNGTARGRTLDLWIDFENPSARWDLLNGWKISLQLDPRHPHQLTGRFVTPNGRRGSANAQRNLDVISPIHTPPIVHEPSPPVATLQADPPKHDTPRPKKQPKPNSTLSPILQKWVELGGADGFLGAPQIDEQRCPDGRGRFIHFAAGSIYWTPETGAHVIYGYIREKWASLGWETCEFLGYPATDETGTPDGIGRFNHFDKGGSIYWTAELGAFEIHGPIRDEWARQGGEAGPLGYPLSDVELAPDKDELLTRFQHGVIRWNLAKDVHVELDP